MRLFSKTLKILRFLIGSLIISVLLQTSESILHLFKLIQSNSSYWHFKSNST